jgi:hypothetical protein
VASALDVRSQIWPAEVSPMPTTMRAAAERKMVISGCQWVVGREPPGDDVLVSGVTLSAVWKQFDQRGLVGDDGVHLLGVSLSQGQRAHGTAAGSEDRGRADVEMGQQPGQVVGPQLRGRVLVPILDCAAVNASRVGGEHGIVTGEQVG